MYDVNSVNSVNSERTPVTRERSGSNNRLGTPFSPMPSITPTSIDQMIGWLERIKFEVSNSKEGSLDSTRAIQSLGLYGPEGPLTGSLKKVVEIVKGMHADKSNAPSNFEALVSDAIVELGLPARSILVSLSSSYDGSAVNRSRQYSEEDLDIQEELQTIHPFKNTGEKVE